MRVRFLSRTMPLLCSGVLLLACSGPVTQPQDGPAGAATADEGYLRGRTLHLAHRYAEAIAAYQAALETDGGHVNARNGLAVAYAQQGDLARAVFIWRSLTEGATLADGPGRAFLFANLGYAQMLNGDLAGAQAALEKACLLDPLNGRAWQYLGETLVRLGQEERGRQMLRQAEALRDHDFRADYAIAARGARLPAIEQAVAKEARDDQAWAVLDIRPNASGVLELRRIPAARAAAAAPVPPPQVPVEGGAVVLLEISNGNGRQGLARQTAQRLRDPGLKVVRLTNEKGFAVRQTRIEYQPAFRTAAERLALRFGTGEPVAGSLAGRADVRLVIGRDVRQDADLPARAVLAQVNLPNRP